MIELLQELNNQNPITIIVVFLISVLVIYVLTILFSFVKIYFQVKTDFNKKGYFEDKCDICGNRKLVCMLFLDSGNQVGFNYVCKDCEEKYNKQVEKSGFTKIGDIEDYGNFCNRPQHSVHETGIFNIKMN